MANASIPIACIDIGSTSGTPACCYANDLSNPICSQVFSSTDGALRKGCQSATCVSDCANSTTLYTSLTQTEFTGNGLGPIQRYGACVNIPSIQQALNSGALIGDFATYARSKVPASTSDESLRQVTSVVTDCLSSTCRRARHSDFCYDNYCSPVRLLNSDASPNIAGINGCMNRLCSGGDFALPFADADVVGIGVFSSYLLQCAFLIILWFGVVFFALGKRKKKNEDAPRTHPKRKKSHQEEWLDFLLEFHKTQCYFSGTLMIASFASDIYNIDLLTSFLLMPLALNGVLPIAFAFLLLVYYNKASAGIAILTVVVFDLASIAYWTLYAHLIPVTTQVFKYDVYRQFAYKLSAIEPCGGYSALAACPDNMGFFTEPIRSAAYRLRIMTPILWTFSAFVMLMLIGLRMLQVYRSRHVQSAPTEEQRKTAPNAGAAHDPKIWRVVFWVATFIFVAGMGMQLSLLAITTDLKMMNRHNWSFGQIVGVTIWIPPVLEYVFKEIKASYHLRNLDSIAQTSDENPRAEGQHDIEATKH